MRSLSRIFLVSSTLLLLAGPAHAQGAKPLSKCAPDAVLSGTVCMDRYEASVWRVLDPTGAGKTVVKKITQGKATVEDLTTAGATQLGLTSDDYAPCGDAGGNCANEIYAVSVAGVVPSRQMTWFQAQQACKNSRKRLPSNAEWQAAVAGTPDTATDNGTTNCNVDSAHDATLTGARSGCVSADGRSTWSATSANGSRIGFRARRDAGRGIPASARPKTISAWRARRRQTDPVPSCVVAISSIPVRVRSRSWDSLNRPQRATSAFGAPAKGIGYCSRTIDAPASGPVSIAAPPPSGYRNGMSWRSVVRLRLAPRASASRRPIVSPRAGRACTRARRAAQRGHRVRSGAGCRKASNGAGTKT